jgi:hypothetical protein
MTDAEILHDIQTKVTVPPWPHLGRIDGRARRATYQAIWDGVYDGIVIRIGGRWRVVTAALRQRRGIPEAKSAA